MRIRTVEEWKSTVKEVIDSKTKEFHSLGYSNVTTDEVWGCLVNRVWNGNPKKMLHEVVQDIFHLKTQIYMNYLTMQAYQDDDLMDSIVALTKNELS